MECAGKCRADCPVAADAPTPRRVRRQVPVSKTRTADNSRRSNCQPWFAFPAAGISALRVKLWSCSCDFFTKNSTSLALWSLQPRHARRMIAFARQQFVAFRAEQGGLRFDSAGIFGIEFAAGLERAPPRSNALFAFRLRLRRGMRGNPGKDARGNRTGEVDAMLARELFAELVDSRDFSLRHFAHQLIHFKRRGNDHRPFAPFPRHFPGDGSDLGQSLAVRQLFLPRLSGFGSCAHGI